MGAHANLLGPSVFVEPGREVTVTLQLRNASEVVDRFQVEILGVPAAWATAEPSLVPLFPGSDGEVAIRFQPPRSSDVSAGPMPYGVKVTSERDGDTVVEEGVLQIGPFQAVSAELVPRTSTGRRGGEHRVVVENQGNTDVTATVVADDPDEQLSFAVQPETIEAAPGETAVSSLKVRARGGAGRGGGQKPFKVRIQPEGGQPVEVDGALSQRAGKGRSIAKVAVLAALLVAGAAALFLFMRPDASTDSASRSVIETKQAGSGGEVKAEDPTTEETLPPEEAVTDGGQGSRVSVAPPISVAPRTPAARTGAAASGGAAAASGDGAGGAGTDSSGGTGSSAGSAAPAGATPAGWESLGGTVTSSPDVSSWEAGRLDLFARGTDNALWHKYYAGKWSGWENLGGTITSDPTAVSWGPNRIDAFARGLNGALWQRWWDGRTWQPWVQITPAEEIKAGTSPDVSSWAAGRLDIFWRGVNDDLRHIWYEGGWGRVESLGGVITSDPGAVSWGPNRIDIFARGTDNALWHRWWENGWYPWESLGGSLAGGPDVSSWGAGRLDIFARTADNKLQRRTFASKWLAWETLSGNFKGDPTAVSWGPNRIDVFVRGQRDDIEHSWFDGAWRP